MGLCPLRLWTCHRKAQNLWGGAKGLLGAVVVGIVFLKAEVILKRIKKKKPWKGIPAEIGMLKQEERQTFIS